MKSRLHILATLVLTGAALAAPVALRAANEKPAAATEEAKAPNVVPVLVLTGSINEVKPKFEFMNKGSMTQRDIVLTLRRAKEDPAVRALIVRIDMPSLGSAQMKEIHDAMLDFRKSGKKLYANFDIGTLGVYTMASAADEIVVPPVAAMDLIGMNAGLYFYRDLLVKLGIKADVVNSGKFKDAMDPFVRDSMGEGTRIQITELMNDFFNEIAANVARNRGVDEAKARELLTGGPYTSRSAKEAGLVDRIAYMNELKDSIEAEAEGVEIKFDDEYGPKPKEKKAPPNIFALLTGASKAKAKAEDKEPKVALVYALGPIVDGRADRSNPFDMGETIASEDFLETLEEVADAGNVKAIVLRVDSPGGSAIASDRIWNRLEQFQREEKIPVVVSMGNVAASGGYYISMGADKIVAEPTTITGSIGVVGGRFTMSGMYAWMGINKQTLSIGANSHLYDENRPWSEEDKALINRNIDDIYDTFTSKVAEGRGITQDRVKEIGGGRVWSGVAAKREGLVDELGGVERAIEIARELGDAADAKLVPFPKEKDLFEVLEEIFSIKASASASATVTAMPAELRALQAVVPPRDLQLFWTIVTQMKDRPTVMTVMPWNLTIK